MMTLARGLVAGVVLAGAAVGLAAPASADPLEGDYTQTITGGVPVKAGATTPLTLTPCGVDCTHWQIPGAAEGFDLHLQGGQWASADGRTVIDATTLEGAHDNSTEGFTFINSFALTKNG